MGHLRTNLTEIRSRCAAGRIPPVASRKLSAGSELGGEPYDSAIKITGIVEEELAFDDLRKSRCPSDKQLGLFEVSYIRRGNKQLIVPSPERR
jgi:hypothetical protein